jgi:hypothetical protein
MIDHFTKPIPKTRSSFSFGSLEVTEREGIFIKTYLSLAFMSLICTHPSLFPFIGPFLAKQELDKTVSPSPSVQGMIFQWDFSVDTGNSFSQS